MTITKTYKTLTNLLAISILALLQLTGTAQAKPAACVNAAVSWNNGKAYFFRGDDYVRYDMASQKAEARLKISDAWKGLWPDGIDASVFWNNNKAYFFKGDQYIRYDVLNDQADPGYPRPIQGNWPGSA